LIFRWAAVFFWCALIFAASSIPNYDPHPPNWSDWAAVFNVLVRKSAHVFEYAVLFMLTRRAIFTTKPGWRVRAPRAAFLFCVLYALSDEWHQNFVPGRMGRPFDVGLDSFGAVSAWLWAPALMRRRAKP